MEAEAEYNQLLYHSKTRWLSLFPAIERLLKLYKPLKEYLLEYFETLPKPPTIIIFFFKDPISEPYLQLVQSFMHLVHPNMEKLEKF